MFISACGYEPLNKSLPESNIKISKKTFSGDNQINRKIFNKIKIDHNTVVKHDDSLKKWLKLLHEYGFAIIKKAPTKKRFIYPSMIFSFSSFSFLLWRVYSLRRIV